MKRTNTRSSQQKFLRASDAARLGKRHQLRLQLEKLESRQLLASDLGDSWSWFQSFDDVPRIAPAELATSSQYDPSFVGPRDLVASEWIVQLTDDAIRSLDSIESLNGLLDRNPVDLTLVAGLGSSGSVLLRGVSGSHEDVQRVLAGSDHVDSFSANRLIEGQLTPNDPEFVTGLLPGLDLVDANDAWDVSIGSLSTVVGVVDTGIDSTHPDLYLNIWLNQGELPPEFLDDEGNKLVDIDADGLITFYDLNNATRSATAPFSLTVGGFATGPNAEFVRDLNGNGRIDAQDLLADANWADGRDTDNNGFFDDFFGVNFRAGADDLLASNDPSDPLGHGTHVAGTIGAVGGNGTGVVGVNWQTSLMSLRILDNNNQGDSGAAIAAINYARQMREQLTTGSDNRVTEGANVRVLNNSWGQPGGYEQSLEAAIIDTNDAGILFVAAAGNGNILGNGVDNDRTPFYPASYDSPNVIAVAASDASDNLATFSNFGRTSVDLVAPGVGIRSTVAGGGYGSANGTSMATPHVAGTAALIWAALPQSTVAEIRDAILGSVQTIPALSEVVATGGRLDAVSAINSNVFAPAAELISKQDISLLGGSTSSFTVRYTHRDGINAASTGDDDVVITRQWGPEVTIPARRTSFSELNGSVTVTYEVDAPGGSWDALDFGDYVISTLPDSVLPAVGSISIRKRELGSFNVRITDDPSVLYATGFNDLLEPGTLRSRITEANAASPTLTTIILDTGRYTIDIPGVVDPDSSFGSDLELAGLQNPGEWFTTSTGDFDITGNVTIVGDTNDETIVDAQGLSRVFKVHSSGTLNLSRLTLQGGVASGGQGGGGIVSLGQLSLDSVIARDNSALSSAEAGLGYGGAIAAFGGNAQLDSSWLSENDADFGGGIHFAGDAGGGLQRSTVSDNQGGGFESLSSQDLSIRNSTFSANTGGHGAIANGLFFNFLQANAESYSPTISADGRFVVFHSDASNLVAGDINNDWDIFVHDRVDNTIEMVSVDNNGVQSNGRSYDPSVSSDGRFIVYQSSANNLVPDDDDSDEDLFVYDRTTQTTERISVGISTASASYSPSISADGRFVAFVSFANDLVANDTNSNQDVFVYDRDQDSFELISVQSDGTLVTGTHRSPSISANGQYVVFESSSTTLVPNDNNSEIDVFIRDRTGLTTEIVSISSAGIQGDDYSRRASISADGRYVAFESQASNFVPDDDNLNSDVFIRDRVQNTTELVSVELVGVAGPNFSINASISADGRYVAFLSHGSNLVANDINGKSDILVRDRILNTTELISVSSSSVQGNEGSGLPSISADGRFVVFDSDASNLVHGDENGIQDIFVRDRVDSTTYSPVVQPPTSLLTISHVTVTSTSSDFEYAVFGDAQVENSLFSGNQVSTDLHPRSAIISSSNVFSDTETSDLIGPLRRFEQLPPTHRLILGNVAIDAATTSTNPEADQLGRSRGDSPDIGALEAIEASLSGVVFFDANQNGVLDFGEQGLSELIVGISDGVGSEESSTNASEGRYSFDRLNTGSYQVTVEIEEDSWSVSTPEIRKVRAATIESNNFSVEPSISGDGQFVAFTSNANNLVPVDENNHTDIFVYDRLANSNELANVHNDGSQSNDTSGSASISNDGRYVAFVSRASNLVDNDNNSVLDVFVHDRLNDTTDIVSMRSDGASGNGISRNPSISSDGRYVTFESAASDLVANDNNGTSDIFIHDRVSNTTELVSVRSDGGQGNGDSSSPSVSADGRYIAFASFARNLVDQSYFVTAIFIRDRLEGTTELVSQFGSNSNPVISQDGRFVTFHGFGRVYVYDRVQGTSEFASVNDSGALGNGQSSSPSISADGRFVAFSSSASDLVAGDSNGQGDVFIRDLLDDTTVRVSVSSDSLQGNDDSSAPSISPDGRFVAFQSFASNLTELDNNGQRDIFVSFNPLADPNVLLRDLKAGEVETALNIGLVPNPGLISGRLFSDTGVENGVFDLGEETLSSKQIFIDANRNGVFDDGELQATTDAEGRYEFADVQSFREHSLVTAAPSGFQQVGLDGDGEFGVSLFLPAGGTISGLDIGFRRVTSSGQSSASALSGRLFEDKNDNGVFDSGVDVPLVGREVYLDAANFGVRDPNEPRELTDADGVYSFAGLSSRNVAVSTTLDETLVHTSPLGSDFQLTKSPLFPTVQPFGNPQAIASGDFDQDGFLDVVVALGEGNKLSIRLNDGAGGFKPDLIDVDLGTAGSGPTSIVVGQFDADTRLDVALTANFASNVVVLLNFDPATQSFDSQSTITVGEEPIDIGFGLFNGDVHLDLVVVNKGNGSIANDESVMLLTNDGNGVFTAGPPIPTGGTDSVELVAGEFTGDAFLDVAVVHSSPASTTTTSGGVTVLAGDGAGSLSHNGNYDEVGAFPIDAASADFDGDGRSDLAVANFNSNSISILLGQADGTFRVQPAILGTASGAFDIAVADIDNDGDQDVIASNLRDRNISIFRNTGVDSGTGDVQFQPLENIGLGQFSLAQRMPLVVANFDNDTSGPGGSGTVDIVTIPQLTDTLHVLQNRLVDGAHRVALTGLNAVVGLDFIIQPAVLPPSLDAISDPSPIVEDSSQQSVALAGITKGRVTGPLLQFVATSSNPSLIPNPTTNHVAGSSNGSLTFTPAANANGQATISVTVIDAGADAIHGTADDASAVQQFVITVLPVNDPPTFQVPANVDVNEDAGAQAVPNFVTGIGRGGGADEAGQTLNPFAVTSDNTFFSVQPAIDASGQLTFTPAANVSGIVTVNVSLSDSGGTASGGSDQLSKAFVINVLPVNDAPSITIGGNQAAQENSGPQSVPGFASGFVRGGGADEASQVISDFVISNDNNGLFSVQPDIANDGTLTFTPAAIANGSATVTVQVRDSGGTARDGVDISTPQTFSINVTATPDTTPPTPVLSTNEPDPTNKSTFDVFVDFGELVTGFVASDITASGATVGTPIDEGDGRYRVPITTSADGAVTVGIAANVANDTSGNANVAATSLTIAVDSTALAPTLTTAEPSPTSNGSFDVTIDFGEVVSGFLASDITLVNGTASNLTGGAGGVYNVTITAVADGLVTVVVPMGAAQDAADNDSLVSAPLSLLVDSTSPAPTINSVVSALTNQSTFVVEVDFKEPVAGFEISDLSLSSGTADALTDLGDGRYTVRVNNAADGAFSIGMAAGAANDIAGNSSLAATDLVRTIDTTAPQPAVATSEPNPTTNSSFVVNIDFGETITDFVAGDLTLLGATVASFQDDGGGQFTITLNAGSDGQVTLIVPSFAAQDLAGNDTLSSTPLVLQVDTTAPVPTISSPIGSATNQSTFDVVIDFGEPVTGFTSTDITAPGATIGTLLDQGNGRFIVPITTSTDGNVTIGVAGAVASDLAGNANLAATSLVVAVDSAALVPMVSTSAPNPSTSGTFDVTIDFGETVTGFAVNDLTLINATASNLRDDGNGQFTLTINAVVDGLVTLVVPSRAAQDTAGNDSTASAPLNRLVDTTNPAPVIGSLVDALTDQSTFDVEIDFGEIVTGFTSDDLALSSGSVESLTDLGGGRYLARVTSLSEGNFTIGLAADRAIDVAGNQNLAAVTLNRTIDTSSPLPALSTNELSPTTNSTFTVAVDFGEAVTGFSAADVAVVGGTISAIVDEGNGRFTASINAVTNGLVNIVVPSLGAQDLAGNPSLASNALEIRVDAIAPLPTLSSRVGSLSNQQTFDIDIDFGEAVNGFSESDITAPGATIGGLVDLGGGRFTVPITKETDGAVTIGIAANVASDEAGNANLAASPLTVTVDRSALIPVVTSAEPSPTSNSVFDVAVDFGEAVTGFVANDLALTGATVTSLRDDGGGRYSITITADGDGQISLVVPSRAAQDAAGNDSLASAPLILQVDSTPPTPTITSLVSPLVNQSTFNVEVDFGEPVVGFVASDLSLSSGLVENVTDLGQGRFQVRLSSLTDGPFTLGLAAGAGNDAAGNASLAATDLSRTIDTGAARPTLNTAESSPTVNSSFTVEIDFGEAVTGLDVVDITVVNANATALQDNGNGQYTVTISAISDGSVTVIVPSLAAQDLAGNATLASVPLNLTVDTTPPAPTLTSLVGSLSNQSTFNIELDFGETVTGFEASDISASDASVGNPIDQGQGRFIVPITRATDGPVSISLGSNVVTDQAGNANLAAVPLEVTVDQTALVPVVGTLAADPSASSTFDVSIDFGEPVAGFVLSDLALINATAANLQDNGNGQFTVTLNAIADGQVILIVPGAAAQDNAGNDSLASSPLTIRVDTTSPSPTVSSLASSLINQTAFNIEIDFGETVSGFNDSDLILTSGVVESLTDLGAGRYLLRVNGVNDGPFTLSLPAGVAADDAGNPSLAATDLTRTIDTGVPLPSLSTTEPSPTTNSSFTATIDFGEPVIDFDVSDLIATGGSVTNLRDDGDGRYTATIDATADGLISVSVPSLVARDPAGNRSLASNVLQIDVDTTAPTTSLRSLVGDLSNQSTFNIEVDFGEPVVGFEAADVSAPGATVGTPVDSGNGRFVVPITKPTDGSVTINVGAGVASDAAGNGNLAATSVQVNVDSSALIPTVSTSESDPTSNNSFEVTIDFGESVNGLNLDDFDLTNAAASNLQDQGNGRFSATITATADGQVNLVLPSGAVQDLAGNESLTSAPLTLRVDTTAPTPTISSEVPSLTNQSAFEVEIDFGEVVSGFDTGDFSLSSGSVESLSDQGDGRYTARIGQVADGVFTLTLAVGAATDDAGNQSLAAAEFTRQVDASFASPELTTVEPNPTSNGSFDINIDFGETVVGFTASDVAAVGATVGGFVDNGSGQFTATITSSSDGQVTLFIPAGAASDEAGNDTAASTILTLVVDTAAPAPSLRLFSAASNQSTFDVEVDFGETVNGFEVSDLVLSSGQVENLSDLGSGRFLARIAGAADGAFTLSLGAGAATDDAGNPSLAADDLTRTTDTGAPLPQLSTSEPTPTTNSSFTVTVDFGEPVTGLDADDVTVVNGSVIGVTPIDAQSFQLNVAATADGPVTVEVLAAASSDLAGNVSLRSQPLVVVFDAAAPVPVIGTDQPSTTGLTTFEITIDFGEPVTGFESSDLTLANATAATEVDLGQGRYEVTLTAISDGPVTIGLPAGAASDVAGRTSLIGNDLQIVVDSQGFNAVLSTTEPSPTNNATFDVLVDFGKDVSGFQASDLVIANGTAGQVTEQTAGSFLVPITATSDGEVTVSVPAGAVVDGTDRGNLPSSTLIINVDRMAPAPMLSTTTSSPTSRSQFDVVIDFGEAVIGFEAGDMQVTGGSVGELREVGDGLFLVPIQPFGDGTLTIEIADGVVVDSASNANTAATPLSIVVDRTAPQATLTTSESNPTTNQSFEVTIDFGEEVLGLVLDDLQVSGGTARDLIDAANGRFTVTIDAQADTNVSIELPEGVATDAVGNANVASIALEITVLDDNPRDFGDAPNASQSGLPSSYPTLLGDNGATHVVGDLFLGGGVTAEVFGQPTALADGDTDDGVRFVVTALASPTNTTISSLAVDASGAGLVDGWIDFNRDGDWNDPGEQIFNSQSVTAGTNLLPYTIPAGASPGDTYARFRLSSVGGLAPTGAAEDGEVEDHLLTLVDTTTRPEMVAKLDGVDSLEVVVSDSEIQLVDGTTILARADKSDTSGITIQDQNDDTITRVAADSMSAGAISVDLANGRSVLRLSTSQLLDLTALASTALQGIDEIDLTEGDHELILNVQQVAQFAANGLTIVFDIEDVISVGDGWQIDDVQLDNGQLLRRIIQDGSIVRFDGPDDYTNPINVFDVNQSGTVTANDALNVINELARGQYSASDGSILDPGTVDLSGFRFYDVTRDLRITALDALRIINELARVLTTSEAEAPMFDQPTSFTKQQTQTVHSVTEITPPDNKLMDAADQEASPATQRNLDTTSDQNAELEAEAVDFVLGQLELEQQV